MDQWRALRHGSFDVDHRGQRVVVDRDRGGSVGGRVTRICEHHRDGVADILGDAGGDRQVSGVAHVVGDRPGAGQGALSPQWRKISAGEHFGHAVDLEGSAAVDAENRGVGFRRAHDPDPDLAVQAHVVYELRFAGQQCGVLTPQAGLSHMAHVLSGCGFIGHGHGSLPVLIGVV